MWSTTHCISWCGVLFVFLDVAYNILYRLMWRKYCSSDIHSISLYGVHPVYLDVTYFLYFLMWRTINSINWYGVHPVFPDVTYFLYFLMCFLMWCIYCSSHIHSISRYGIYTVYTDVAYIFLFPDMESSILYLLMWRIYTIRPSYIAISHIAYILYFLVQIFEESRFWSKLP